LTGAAISVRELTFTHRGSARPALVDVNLTIPDGTFTAIMGHAGCGKSSLCLALNGLIPRVIRGRFQGSVAVRGRLVGDSAVADLAQVVGLVFQDFESQLVSTNVELEVAFGPENFAVPREEIRRRIDRYLKLVGLDGLRRREPASLSGGQKQRLAIASVLALEPDILVMDEPTTDLDSIGQDHVLHIAHEVTKARRTLVLVEHDAEAVIAADQVILMKEGGIVASGPARGVLSDPGLLERCGVRPPQVAELFKQLGSPEIPLTVEEGLAQLQASRRPIRTAEQRAPTPVDGPVAIQARSASYTYRQGDAPALREVDLTIRRGEFLAIVGQNGSGKTTLGKLLSGLLQPSRGEVLLGGVGVASLDRATLARLVGYVFQNPDSQIFSPTVYEEVSFGPSNFGIPRAEIKDRVAESLRAVGLDGYERRDPFALTKGERQRVAVASVLASRPGALILDEPTTGLDYRQQVGMMEMLARLYRAGHTIVIITHSMWAATDYAARTVVMQDGSITLDGATRYVFTREDVLASAALRPPPIVRLSNRIGARVLTMREMVAALGPAQIRRGSTAP
jgi:energy-coupling factor transporter ATP-binding protein EcfA2